MSHKILLFTARGCPQCNVMYPVIRKVAEENHIVIEHVNVDDDKNKHLIDRYNVLSIPAMILFGDRGEIFRSVGLKNEIILREEVYEAIK